VISVHSSEHRIRFVIHGATRAGLIL
jgi:hypothetical protein